ncbi:MAG: bifunctional phosphopantothenoylcysteine decarboxylase/phosphopantothenate--cysteine ligase CoaBC [Nocardioidaceae bacterium]|nr:bifunctional phosphopantothenoylcysteine decarboxylase/phosphopantothenate--cysteine ligase CoaBC [Nocardioidaceae bacterium]
MTTVPPHVVLGVGGGIAAYKVCDVLRRLTESGHDVTVVPTAAALRFVGSATWEALSGRPVASDVFSTVPDVPHVRLGREADLVLVAPATADLLARAAAGLADDLLTATLLTARCPVLFAPAMHTEMWEHPATVANVGLLRSRGAVVVDPATGRLTGADSGPGRLPDPEHLVQVATALLRRGVVGDSPDLVGRRVVVSAGGTREPLDPVRFLGNRSSGRMGYALAVSAVARGATVSVVAANVSLPDPAGADVVRVGSTDELREAVLAAAAGADAVVMAAAPADFRPASASPHKIKKSPDGVAPPAVALEPTPDVLAELARTRVGKGAPLLVGFAAETGDDDGDVLTHARAKLSRKGCDLLVVNDVSAGRVFGRDDTEAVLLGADGTSTPVAATTKIALADVVWDAVVARLSGGTLHERP